MNVYMWTFQKGFSKTKRYFVEILFKRLHNKKNKKINRLYNINTNEIPGELSRENMISSHVKIACYLYM